MHRHAACLLVFFALCIVTMGALPACPTPTPPPPPPAADPQLVMKRPMELACLMAVRNRLAAAIAHLELPPLAGGWLPRLGRGWGWGGVQGCNPGG